MSYATRYTVSLLLSLNVLGCKEPAALPTNQKMATGTETRKEETPNMSEKATFAAGCFWGVEATFRKVPGVIATSVGYTGGWVENPTYEMVCTDKTGHAEAVEVLYNPEKVSYDQLLEVFWECHAPTQKNRQGPDIGTQYRSAIFFHTPEQQQAAQNAKKRLEQSGKFRRPIATEILPASTFWRAEDYHQQYLEKQGLPNCHLK